MTWWIVGGVVLLALVLLVVVLLVVAGHLRPLERAVRRLRLRAEQAEGLQTKLATIQQQLADLQTGVDEVTARTAQMKGGRTDARR